MEKNKHNHKGTKKLKVCLFSVFMLLPFLTLLPNVLYYAFNEHATNSEATEITYKYETNEVNNENDLINNNIYDLNLTINDEQTQNLELEIKPIKATWNLPTDYWPDTYIDEYNPSETEIQEDIITQFAIYINIQDSAYTIAISIGGNDSNYITAYIDYYDIEQQVTLKGTWQLLNIKGKHIYTAFHKATYNEIEKVNYTQLDIQDTLHVAHEKMWQNDFYKWTNTTEIKTPVASMTSIFGIEANNKINNYIVYWTAITIIYIILDIIIEAIVYLTHLIGNRE